MTSGSRSKTTAEDVVGWFSSAVRRSGAGVPNIDSPKIASIVRLVNDFRAQIDPDMSPADRASLEVFGNKYIEVGSLIKKLTPALSVLKKHSIEQLGPDDNFIQMIDRLHSILKTEWIDEGYDFVGRSPVLWHQWARYINGYVVAAWAEAGQDWSRVNANNPAMRVLKAALLAIDGEDRDEKSIEQVLRRASVHDTTRNELIQ